MFSYRPNYKDYANGLKKTTWVKQDFTSDIAFFTFLMLLENIWKKKIDEKPLIFIVLQNEKNERDIITPTTLQETISGESAYKEILLIMETSLHQQATIKK